ncbi:hypothetical protein D2T31_04930 [Sinirhodobacter populi]|uniref:Uncharacterized protein n=2 Tax=Paenirhodobacter populi TaxID=2306993 RepID=A0A443KF03_9RHOB|nr:hypothetical protein D2T31_04930 [Sinirhodobacter populi]
MKADLRQLRDRDARIAITWALNDTATEVLSHVQNNMEQVFDRPTRFTLNAFTVRGARPSSLEAIVQERPSVGSRHYLKVEEAGGARPQTGVERNLNGRLAYSGIIEAAVPAAGAKLDAYGNWSRGERNQVLSAVQAQNEASSNTTEASRKRNRKRAGYFVPRPGSKLSPGIWKRAANGDLSKVLHFTDAVPRYRPRLKFYEGAEEVYDRSFPRHLARTLAKMVAKRSK